MAPQAGAPTESSQGAPPLADLYTEHLRSLCRGYDRALRLAGLDSVVVHAGLPVPRHPADDQDHPLRVTPTFQHWLPLSEAGCAVHYRPGQRPTLLRPRQDDFWSGATPAEADHFWPHFDVAEIAPGIDALRAKLHSPGRVGFIGHDDALGEQLGLLSGSALQPLNDALDQLRAIKSPYEQHCIALANGRAAVGHRAVREAFEAGERRELHLHLSYLAASDQDGSQTPYQNIVAVGAHAAVLHHAHYATRPPPGAPNAACSLLVDAGAQYMGYHSDITRTHVSGRGADADLFRALVAGIDALQQQLCAEVLPGSQYESLHERAHHLLAALLCELGLASGDAAGLIDAGVTRALFPHGLGHSLGLQTHDVGCRLLPPRGDHPFLRNTSAITPGQVFTVEPGCYLIPSLLAELQASPGGKLLDFRALDALRPFGGVRIEDNLLVTAEGAVNLTRAALP